jgi:hypothetical protein
MTEPTNLPAADGLTPVCAPAVPAGGLSEPVPAAGPSRAEVVKATRDSAAFRQFEEAFLAAPARVCKPSIAHIVFMMSEFRTEPQRALLSIIHEAVKFAVLPSTNAAMDSLAYNVSRSAGTFQPIATKTEAWCRVVFFRLGRLAGALHELEKFEMTSPRLEPDGTALTEEHAKEQVGTRRALLMKVSSDAMMTATMAAFWWFQFNDSTGAKPEEIVSHE